VDLVLAEALVTTARTAFNTVLYAGGAGLVATAIGFIAAIAIGRSPGLRSAAMVTCIMIFAWPPAAGALGVVYLAATAPPAFDVLVRSRLTVCLVLALHLLPIATGLALRSIGSLSPSWTYAAAVHGVGFGRFARRVLWPALRPSVAISIAVVALLASADAGSVLLLHPPGETSLPLSIFTIMANAPEATVASLCLVYLGGTIALLMTAGFALGRAS
jgi:ABC-type Fe3+ transport system permease subunit